MGNYDQPCIETFSYLWNRKGLFVINDDLLAIRYVSFARLVASKLYP